MDPWSEFTGWGRLWGQAPRGGYMAGDSWVDDDSVVPNPMIMERVDVARDIAQQLGIDPNVALQAYAEALQGQVNPALFAGASDYSNMNLRPGQAIYSMLERTGNLTPERMQWLNQWVDEGNTLKDQVNAQEKKDFRNSLMKFGTMLAGVAAPGLMGLYPGQAGGLSIFGSDAAASAVGEGVSGGWAEGAGALGSAANPGHGMAFQRAALEAAGINPMGAFTGAGAQAQTLLNGVGQSLGSAAGSSIADTVKSAMSNRTLATAASGLMSAAMQDGTTYDPNSSLDAIRYAEDTRQARVRANTGLVNDQFAGFDDNYYDGIAKLYIDHYTPLLSEQYGEAKRKMPMRFASRDSSAYQREMGNLERDYGRAQADIGKGAQDFATSRRSNVENARSNLVSMAASDLDADTITRQAGEAARIANAQPNFEPLADLFGKYTGDFANMRLAQQYGYQPAVQRPLLFGTSGSGSSRGTRTVG